MKCYTFFAILDSFGINFRLKNLFITTNKTFYKFIYLNTNGLTVVKHFGHFTMLFTQISKKSHFLDGSQIQFKNLYKIRQSNRTVDWRLKKVKIRFGILIILMEPRTKRLLNRIKRIDSQTFRQKERHSNKKWVLFSGGSLELIHWKRRSVGEEKNAREM